MPSPSRVRWLLGALLVFAAAAAGREASAAPKSTDAPPQETAKSYYERATSAFGLGDYKRAAQLYEKAFELRADAALLYNAAQAHRMGGAKERALELYRNYVRLFPDSKQAPDARRHMEELEGVAAGGPVPLGDPTLSAPAAARPTSPPSGRSSTPPPSPSGLALAPQPPPPAAGPTAPGSDLTKPAGAPDDATGDGPRRSRAWIWVTVGGLAVVAGAITTAVLLTGKTQDPTPSLGTVGERSAP